MAKSKVDPKFKCFLPDSIITPILSAQELRQNPGWWINSFGLSEVWKSCAGEDCVIGSIDTGCQMDHEDLADNLIPGCNFVNPGEPCDDDNGHGTHTIGIMCAENNELGIVGVAPKCKVLVCKVLGKNGTGDMRNAAKAIDYCIENNVDVINLSLGAPFKIPVIEEAIIRAYNKNIPVVCASGNAGNKRKLFSPADSKFCLSVAAIDENMTISNFSNISKNLDFVAPGANITSTTSVPKNWYVSMSGTSMATPYISASIALLKSYIKKRHPKNLQLITVEDFRRFLKSNCKPVVNSPFNAVGILDVDHYVKWLNENSELDNLPQPPST